VSSAEPTIKLRFVREFPFQYGANEPADRDEPSDPRYVRITDVTPNGHLRPETFKSLPMRIARPYLLSDGDLLLARSGATVGKVFMYKSHWGTCCFAGYLIRFAVDRAKAIPRFVWWYTQSKLWNAEVQLSTIQATIQNVSAERYGEFRMPLPPLATQKAIADFLDRKTAAIDALIEKKQKLLDLLAEKRAALINQAVTKGLDPNVPMKDSGIPWIGEIPAHWETPQLGHCLARITYGFTCPMPTTDDGPYMLTANDIRDGFVDYENARKTDAGAAKELTEKCLPRAGDVLLTKDGTLGRIAVADGSDACINQSVALLRANGRLSSSFLSWLLRSSSYQDWMVFDAGGTTIKHIYITRVVKMTALVPPVSEQAAIVSEAGRIDKLLQRALRGTAGSIERLQEYRQALITAAVTGQLDIPDEPTA